MMELQKFRRYERIWAAQLGLCLVVSDQERDRLRRIQPKARIEVIPNGVDTSYFHPSSIPSNPERLVFTGSMSHMPNVDAVIFFCEKILPLVQAYHPDVSLDIVGTNPLPRVQALARQHRNVRVTGAVEDVRPYIWDAAVYIAPIRTGGGSRLKILEALACGKAVVATAFACEGLDLRDGTHVLLRDAAEDSAKAIIDLIENPQHAYCLGTAGWDFVVKHYDWSCIGTMLFGEYCRLSEAAHRVDPRR
jgi:glycosyltransferase involved in cell wall biosynthesis